MHAVTLWHILCNYNEIARAPGANSRQYGYVAVVPTARPNVREDEWSQKTEVRNTSVVGWIARQYLHATARAF